MSETNTNKFNNENIIIGLYTNKIGLHSLKLKTALERLQRIAANADPEGALVIMPRKTRNKDTDPEYNLIYRTPEEVRAFESKKKTVAKGLD